MNFYRVSFVNNKATAAEQVDAITKDSAIIDVVNGKRQLRCFTIIATSEQESICIANKIFQDYLGFLHK